MASFRSEEPLSDPPTEVWQNNGNDVVRPTMNIVDIAPDPYEGPLTSLQIVFSEPVGGFELGDLRLSRQNAPGASLLGHAQTLTTLDRQTWTLGNLTGVTQARDRYTLSLSSNHLIFDLAGNPLASVDTESWIGGDSQKPYADIVPVAPDPRTGSVDSIKIVFTEPVTGFDLKDLILDPAFDGKGSPFTGQETLTTTDHIEWTLGNLAAATSAGGHYYLRLENVGSGIVDLSGNALGMAVNEDWLNDIGDTNPPTVAIEAVAPDPRVTGVADVKIVFSEPVTGVKASQFRLTRRFEGNAYDLTSSLTLNTTDQVTWTLGGLAGTSARAPMNCVSIPAPIRSETWQATCCTRRIAS